uniref:Kinesin motor domain-containing protein n=2 Tax=Manihot esculenta TaxID=3983 RepID=A0A2C9TZP5_MANES
MLTIVDLAGAERERRTRNQGSRLLESNFINNTSMVFGLCLRSLLEHQKNPKKPLQKHFQNSLLTRYLRDYLEGKKRMALVLTVKPGEEDYLDTVYLLRQASPYMKIKFNNVDEQLNSVHQKRHIQSLCRVEAPKRKKYCALDSNETEGKSTGDKHQLLEEDGPQKSKFDSTNIALVKDDCVDLTIRDRNHQIMQNFAKALWNVLKEYKEKLMVADKEIESLNENLGSEKSRYIKLEKEFEDFKSCCTCSKENSMEALKVDTDFHAKVYIAGNECSNFDEAKVKRHSPNLKVSECAGATHDQDVTSRMDESVHPPNLKEPKCSSTPTWDLVFSTQVEVRSHSPNLKASVCISTPEHDQCVTTQVDEGVHSPNVKESKCRSTPTWDQDIPSQTEVKSHSPSLKASECTITATHDQDVTSQMGESVHSPSLRESKYTKSPTWDQDISVQVDVNVHSPHSEASKYSSTQDQAQDFLTKKQLDLPPSEEDVVSSKQCNLDVPDCGIRSDNSCKSLNLKKPKRRLLPASSILLRDITAFGIEDEPQKPKGNRGGKILPANEKTQGSISLRRLLQSNLRL